MKNKLTVGIGIGILTGSIVVCALNTTVVGDLQSSAKSQNIVKQLGKTTRLYQKMKVLGETIEEEYIGETDREKMVEGIYRGFVYGLNDNDTVYLSKEEFEKEQAQADGTYIGTGLEFTWGLSQQYLIVTDVIPNSPAAKQGIEIGDRITQIDGIKAMMSNEQKLYEMLGDISEKDVIYKVEARAGNRARLITLKAEAVQNQLIKSQLLNNQTGYVELAGLKEGIAIELQTTLEALKADGAKQFILDVRNLSTNDLEAIRQIGTLFIDNSILFNTQNGKDEITSYKTQKAIFNEPVALLTSQDTEGAIEGLISAFKTYNRGKIIGDYTAGHGIVEKLVALEDGSGLKIKVGKLLKSDQSDIEEEGIKPDVLKIKSTQETLKIVTTGQLSKSEDSVLQAALKTLK